MIYFTPIEEPVPGISCCVPTGALVIFRITLESCFSAPTVLQPRLEVWNNGTEQIPNIPLQVEPLYNYLYPGMQHTISVSFQLPDTLPEATVLRSTLRFSGFKHCSLPIELTLVTKDKDNDNTLFLHERAFKLPLTGAVAASEAGEERRKSGNVFFTDSIMKLLTGMDALEKIPSRWMVTEMILTVADNGRRLAGNEALQDFVTKLQRTIFFKNGALVVAGSQILHWLSTGHGITSNLNALSGKQAADQERMLYNWEKWIINLVGEDIEHAAATKHDVQFEPPKPFEVLLSVIDNKPDKLFLYFILGVMEISPRLKAVIGQIVQRIPEERIVAQSEEKFPVSDVLSEEGSLQR